MKQAALLFIGIIALASTSVLALDKATVKANCEKTARNQAQYSVCLDEKMKMVERELETWITLMDEKLEEAAKGSGRYSILSEFRRSNKFYNQYIESQCRRVFFQEQHNKGAVDEYRLCKIVQTKQRIENLESENK